MLLSRQYIESVLPIEFEQLQDEFNSNSLSEIAECLFQSLKELQVNINTLAKENLTDLEPEIDKSEQFIKKIGLLHRQIDNVKRELSEQENLLKNVSQIEEYKSLIDHVEIINKMIQVVESLREYEAYLTDLKSAIDSKNYIACNELLIHLAKLNNDSELFGNKPTSTPTSPTVIRSNESINFLNNGEILIVKELKEDLCVQRERLWYELDQEWDRFIRIELSSDDATIFVNKKVNQDILDRLSVFALHVKPIPPHFLLTSADGPVSFVFATKLKQFSAKFLRICEKSLIQDSMQVIQEENGENNEYSTIKVVACNDQMSRDQDNENPLQSLEFKLEQILILLQHIHERFFRLLVFYVSPGVNPKNSSQIKLMSLFSASCLNDLLTLIYEQLVLTIIPVKSLDMTLESHIDSQIKKFERDLNSIDFFSTNATTTQSTAATAQNKTQFESNLEELFIRKKCKFIMDTARNFMKNNDLIFELATVTKTTSKNEEETTSSIRAELLQLNSSSAVTSSINDLLIKTAHGQGAARTSKLAQQVLVLVHETLNDAYKMLAEGTQSVKNVLLLCLIARNLFDLYASIVPTYHAAQLKALPLLPVIMYNDLAYLAVNCLTLTHQYRILLKSINGSVSESSFAYHYDVDEIVTSFSFLDLSVKLMTIGQRILISELEKQQLNLLELLNENSIGLKYLSEGNNYEVFTRSLKKCTYHLNSLSSIWRGVLSLSNYLSVFGQLIDLICRNLLKSVLDLEDISTDDARYMHSSFLVLKQAVYDLFNRQKQIHESDSLDTTSSGGNSNEETDLNAIRHIKSWQRFKYILVILKANLQEIVDLWSDGVGPLPLYFDSEEVRHLIRALFMISDRRSAALARIK